MYFQAARQPVFNRGAASIDFLCQLVTWARTAPDALFARNNNADIYGKVSEELGPYEDLTHRKAVMLHVLQVLGLFESGSNDAKAWNMGPDSSKSGTNTSQNAEAGRWQESWDSRGVTQELRDLAAMNRVTDGEQFQRTTKQDHAFAMQWTATLLRHTTEANGPLYKGDERKHIWPKRPELWGPEQSIYPYLTRDAVQEFKSALTEA